MHSCRDRRLRLRKHSCKSERENRPINSRQEMDRDVLRFRENCSARADKDFDAYKDFLEQVLRVDVLYQSVSIREKQDIFKVFNSGVQHVYNIHLFPPLTEFVQAAADGSSIARARNGLIRTHSLAILQRRESAFAFVR